MKKSQFYLLFTLAALFFLGSCSHTREASRFTHGELQYAQSAPEAANQAAEALSQTKPPAAPELIAAGSQVLNAPELNPVKSKADRKISFRAASKHFEKAYVSAEKKIVNNPVFAKAAKKKAEPMLSGKLKLGLVLIIIGALIVWLLPWPLSIIGWIMEVIGVIFLVFWLLELLEGM